MNIREQSDGTVLIELDLVKIAKRTFQTFLSIGGRAGINFIFSTVPAISKRNKNKKVNFYVPKSIYDQYKELFIRKDILWDSRADLFVLFALMPAYFEPIGRSELSKSLDQFIFQLKLYVFLELEKFNIDRTAKLRFKSNNPKEPHVFVGKELKQIASLVRQSYESSKFDEIDFFVDHVFKSRKASGVPLEKLEVIERLVISFNQLKKDIPKEEPFRLIITLILSDFIRDENYVVVGNESQKSDLKVISLIKEAFIISGYISPDSPQEEEKKISKAFYTEINSSFLKSFDILFK
jgi:hypothetical protein